MMGRQFYVVVLKRRIPFLALQVTIVCGETGCGKTTQVPQFLLEDMVAQGAVRAENVFFACWLPAILLIIVSTVAWIVASSVFNPFNTNNWCYPIFTERTCRMHHRSYPLVPKWIYLADALGCKCLVVSLQGGKCNIVCTQPRRLSAIAVAQRVAGERQSILLCLFHLSNRGGVQWKATLLVCGHCFHFVLYCMHMSFSTPLILTLRTITNGS
jgi:hypothetical protein